MPEGTLEGLKALADVIQAQVAKIPEDQRIPIRGGTLSGDSSIPLRDVLSFIAPGSSLDFLPTPPGTGKALAKGGSSLAAILPTITRRMVESDGAQLFSKEVIDAMVKANKRKDSLGIATTMPPEQFLSLASRMTKKQAKKGSKTGESGLKAVRANLGRLDSPPTLVLDNSSPGVLSVVGHDGRHRSYVALEEGIEEIPVWMTTDVGRYSGPHIPKRGNAINFPNQAPGSRYRLQTFPRILKGEGGNPTAEGIDHTANQFYTNFFRNERGDLDLDPGGNQPLTPEAVRSLLELASTRSVRPEPSAAATSSIDSITAEMIQILEDMGMLSK